MFSRLLYRLDKALISFINPDRPTSAEITNIQIEVSVNIPSIIKSTEVQDILSKLSNSDHPSFKDKSTTELTNVLSSNYLEKYNRLQDLESSTKNEIKFKNNRTDDLFKHNPQTQTDKKETSIDYDAIRDTILHERIWEKVKFNIKNRLLWIDGKISFDDIIFFEWDIPFGKSNIEKCKTTVHDIRSYLTIRIIVVNGILRLQVGRLYRDVSSDIRDHDYLAYQTITSYPLMYCYGFMVPTDYLNYSIGEIQDRFRNEKEQQTVLTETEREFMLYDDMYRTIIHFNDLLYKADAGRLDKSKIFRDFEYKGKNILKENGFEHELLLTNKFNNFMGIEIIDLNSHKDTIMRTYSEHENRHW